ncbi:PHD finger protein MALE STERILITY 1 [Rhodamnia argentea]|uniref:PHD finger protein MALE STERILITY 1 n=1 Tax=Rhodamnia argentea TaxID=178133 RepID=A0A8B8QWR1_9MYRT|nr:PHD finger protein MALE STERILITY 1 [Rhodamnia argentea]
MSHWDLMGCKKRKRGERVFRFKSFGESGYPVDFNGSFLENVKALLELGQSESGSCVGVPCWSFELEINCQPPLHVLLYVIEEPIEASLSHHCKHCLYVGWGQHLICNKKYHFLLLSKDITPASLISKDDSIDANPMKVKCNLTEAHGHTMHGVFHSNGFGHLMCINGLESGSDLPGFQIMDFWDRLCTGLKARKVSLNDASYKRGMELRLLHGLAYGEPWFGRWGYRFGRGSFGVTLPMYKKAIEAIQGMPLTLLIHHLGSSGHDVLLIFSRYQSLSDRTLVSLGDLFHFMSELVNRVPRSNFVDSYYSPGFLLETACRWSPKRVEMATRVIVEALKSAEFRWVSRQEVRDAARAYIGDTGLLDFVLKSLGNHVVGKYLVRRSLNPVTKVLEYCLEDVSKASVESEGSVTSSSNLRTRSKVTRVQLMKDMFCVYKHIFKEREQGNGTCISDNVSLAARIILDSRYLIKEYTGDLPSKLELGLGGKFKLFCTVLLRDAVRCEWKTKPMPPDECVVLKENATVNELKVEVERTFRELYWGLKSFVAESVVNLNTSGSEMVFGLVEVGRRLVFEGSVREQGATGQDVYECGPDGGRVVDCACGAKEDDGERMIACAVCEVWQHTWCVQIPNGEEVPGIFLCKRCEQVIMVLPSLP